MKNFVSLDNDFHIFIKKNFEFDANMLRLKSAGKQFSFDVKLAIDQIEARKKTRSKLSTFISNDRFLFPSILAAEQSTHECVATYNASILESTHFVLDMTAGLGIDAFTFVNAGRNVLAIEMDIDRAKALQYNAQALGIGEDVKIINENSLLYIPRLKNFLAYKGKHISGTECAIFIDPARRGEANSRTYFLEDCVPDITSHLDELYSYAETILVKASPILDIRRATEQLPGLKKAHIVAFSGEVKEVLLLLKKDYTGEILLKGVNLNRATKDSSNFIIESEFQLSLNDTGNSNAPIADKELCTPGAYIYDPSAAVHKMQAGNALCEHFPGLYRLSNNSDLYTSEKLFNDFPGRKFIIRELIDNKNQKTIKGARLSIISRNYPMSADKIKSRYKINESENHFLIATRIGIKEAPIMLLTERV